VVPATGTTANVTLVTPAGPLVSSKVFRVIPAIASFMPASGVIGTSIVISGTGLTQTSKVTFGGVKATVVSINSATQQVTAKVPSGSKTGKIAITTPGGTATRSGTFKVTPVITSFSPASGAPGTSVVITGSGLTQTTKVAFGGVAATTFIVNSDSQVTVKVPTGAVTGNNCHHHSRWDCNEHHKFHGDLGTSALAGKKNMKPPSQRRLFPIDRVLARL
jgi:hypothetical protein